MINFAIRIIKKYPFFYNLARKISSILNRKKNTFDKKKGPTYYAFILNDLDELAEIKEKYEKIKKFDTKLFILINNSSYNILMHRIIRENPDICFSSFDYFERYNAKISNQRIVWFNLSAENENILNHLA